MPEEVYSRVTIDGRDYWEVDCKARILVDGDPDQEVLILVATPQSGYAALGPFVKGDPGKHSVIDPVINFTALAPGDLTQDSASWTVLTPGSDTVSQVVRLNLALHDGQPGDDGTTSIDVNSVAGTKLARKAVVLNSTLDGFEYASLPVGGMHWPSTITEAAAQSAGVTLGLINVAPNTYQRDWTPTINASTIIVGSTADVQVDLVARLGADNGPVVGRGYGVNGTNDKIVVTSGPDAGAAIDINKIPAGAAATIYLRAEKQSGTATYTTSRTRFSIEAISA